MRWNAGQRETYVLGYTAGYLNGFMGGCKKGTNNWPVEVHGYQNLPLNKCLNGQPDFSQGPESLVDQVTQFYSRYPNDRDILPYEVIDLLGSGLSIEQINRYPFMRHRSTNTKR